jgi:proteasome lid subunit RPN8/RPN11
MAPPADVHLPWLGWWRLVRELRRRGGGIRESGAFLLGRRSGQRSEITSVVYYDDIDPHALAKGYVQLSGSALSQVWDRCVRLGLEVLADIHTHPGSAGQSESDQDYPMVALKGHIALIVPDFARSFTNLRDIGVYRHLGGRRWITLPAPRAGWRGLSF